MEPQTLEAGKMAENGYMLLSTTRTNNTQPIFTFTTFNSPSYPHFHSNMYGGGRLWLVLVAGYSNLKYSVGNDPSGLKQRGYVQNGKGRKIRQATYPSTTSRRQGHFQNAKRQTEFLSDTVQAVLPAPLLHRQVSGMTTQPSEADVAKRAAVSPADGN